MEQKFYRYVAVQYSGVFNMITEASSVMRIIEVDLEDYCYIQEHYKELKEEYKTAYDMGVAKGTQLKKNLED